MSIEQSQKLCGMLMEDGYHCWIVEGYHINLLLDNQLYTIKTYEESPDRSNLTTNG